MQQRFLLQTLLLAEHVSGTTVPINRSSKVLYSGYVSGLQDAAASSGAQEYYTVVAACGISCCGFQVAGLVWS